MSGKPAFEAMKSYSDGHVAIRGNGKSWGAEATVRANLTTAQARVLAASPIALADAADAKVAKKAAAEDRRRKWLDREVAAGRMKIFSAREFMR